MVQRLMKEHFLTRPYRRLFRLCLAKGAAIIPLLYFLVCLKCAYFNLHSCHLGQTSICGVLPRTKSTDFWLAFFPAKDKEKESQSFTIAGLTCMVSAL